MKRSTIILGAVLIAVFFVALFSYIMLKQINNDIRHTAGLDKASLVYGYFSETAGSGNLEKAEKIALEMIRAYPHTDYSRRVIEHLASDYADAGRNQKALYYYRMLMSKYPRAASDPLIKEKVNKINSMLFQGEDISSDNIIEYTIRPGDNLFSIAGKYTTTIEYIQQLNGLKNDLIRAGQKIKIDISEFSIYVDKFNNIMILSRNGKPFRSYSVATGKNNSTPVGVFKITDKMIKPPWTRPDGKIIHYGDPEYELGERWMPISQPGFGIHGTNDESSIGKQATLGCVRMRNADVVEVYNIVPRGTRVEIVDTDPEKR